MIDTALVAIVAVGFSAMILATAPIALLLATGFVFTQVAFNLAGSLKAMDYYCIGDKETARRYASLDLKDGFLAAGSAVGFEEESGIIYDGCNLVATIVLLYAPATMLKNRIKNKVSKLLSGSADDVIVGGSDAGIWDSIKGTADNMPNTEIPATFQVDLNGNISYVNPTTETSTLWTNANATEHMGESIGRFGAESESIGVRSQTMLESYSASLNEAMQGIATKSPGRYFGTYGNWELGINTETGVVFHARIIK